MQDPGAVHHHDARAWQTALATEDHSMTHKPYHGRRSLSMSSLFPHHSPHQLPQPPDIDHAAAMRAARWEA
jgi:hypothetical protein